MSVKQAPGGGNHPLLLSATEAAIVSALGQLKVGTAEDLARLLEKSDPHMRQVLRRLSGGADFVDRHVLLRFPVPSVAKGEKSRAYTLGSKGRDLLAVEGYYRPSRFRHLSFGYLYHALALSRIVVCATRFARHHPDYQLVDYPLCYELARIPPRVRMETGGKERDVAVIPDAWLHFVTGAGTQLPIFLEIDRCTMPIHRFQAEHLRARLELLRSGKYEAYFGVNAVQLAYVITGSTRELRDGRLFALCRATVETVTREISPEHRSGWLARFRLIAVDYADLLATPLFTDPLWCRPDDPFAAIPLFITPTEQPAHSADKETPDGEYPQAPDTRDA